MENNGSDSHVDHLKQLTYPFPLLHNEMYVIRDVDLGYDSLKTNHDRIVEIIFF